MNDARATDVGFVDLLLTMDIVDELRHEQRVLEQVVDSAENRSMLKQKLLDYYNQNGIEVTDAILEAGIEAKLKDRFTFKAPTPSFAVRLATAYVNRVYWYKRSAQAIALILFVQLGFYLTVDLPEQQRIEAEIASVNQDIVTAQSSLKALQNKHTSLVGVVENIQALSKRLHTFDVSNREAVKHAFDAFAAQIETVSNSRWPEPVTADTLASYRQNASSKFVQLQKDLAESRDKANAVSTLIAVRNDIALRDVELANLEDKESSLIGHEALRAKFDTQKMAGITALMVGDLITVNRAINSMNDVLNTISDHHLVSTELVQEKILLAKMNLDNDAAKTLSDLVDQTQTDLNAYSMIGARKSFQQLQAHRDLANAEYSLRVVNEKGMRSGVWRYFDNNRSKRAFYIVVDALDGSGSPVELPILNQETSEVIRTSRYAVQVSEPQYNKVGQDKTDDGIIQNNIVGKKMRGHLHNEYSMDVVGGFITSW